MDREILYIWLSRMNGIGPILASNLINYFGTIEEVYNATMDELVKVEGIGIKLSTSILANKNLEASKRNLEKYYKNNIQVVTKGSPNYPKILSNELKAPLILYVKGNLKHFDNSIAIVGSRRCNEYGKKVTVELAEALSKNKIPIISGLAKGIDSYAHTVALKNDSYTIAVLGTSVDKCYPCEHINLFNTIIESGVIISQFEPGTYNIKENFLKRNELIAMLSNKVVVVQASKDSGALYTAKCGLKYKKEVYAVPSLIYDKFSEGTNMLIKNGAKIYLSTESIVNNKVEDVKTKVYSEDQSKVLGLLSNKPMSLDSIKEILGLTTEKIEEVITEMEISGSIKLVGGLIRI